MLYKSNEWYTATLHKIVFCLNLFYHNQTHITKAPLHFSIILSSSDLPASPPSALLMDYFLFCSQHSAQLELCLSTAWGTHDIAQWHHWAATSAFFIHVFSIEDNFLSIKKYFSICRYKKSPSLILIITSILHPASPKVKVGGHQKKEKNSYTIFQQIIIVLFYFFNKCTKLATS